MAVPIESCRNHMFPTSLSQFNGRSCNSPGCCGDPPRGSVQLCCSVTTQGLVGQRVRPKWAVARVRQSHFDQERPPELDPLKPTSPFEPILRFLIHQHQPGISQTRAWPRSPVRRLDDQVCPGTAGRRPTSNWSSETSTRMFEPHCPSLPFASHSFLSIQDGNAGGVAPAMNRIPSTC